MYLGFVTLADTLHAAIQTRNGDLPIDSDALPTFRIYGSAGILPNAGGAGTFKHTGTLDNATNATPIQIHSAAHGLSTGNRVKISGVNGNTAANGTWTITKVDADNFTLDTSVGNGAYTNGGTWHVAGFYDLQIDATAANGFDAGKTYVVQVSWQISSAAKAEIHTLGVV
jgi:hypothetical protein